jgi:hypothetical protein
METFPRRRAAGIALLIAAFWWPVAAAATESRESVGERQVPMAPDASVRGVSSKMVAIIEEAAARSTTFRGLVNQIGDTDGVVYVAEGRCGHDVRACLLFTMTMMGPHRVLRVLVDPGKVDTDLMGSIAHELRHALEVLSNPQIRTNEAMFLLYHRIGEAAERRFETPAAIETGTAVRAELRRGAGAGERDAAR